MSDTLEVAFKELAVCLSCAPDALKKVDEALEDAQQLADVDLQNILQKQQQTLQMMSNISKMLHDTATSVNRKIGS
jgi:hypothetical protein